MHRKPPIYGTDRKNKPGGRRLIIGSVVCCLALSLTAAVAEAKIRLPSVISNNMVLQRGIPLPIWGWASGGETVTVTLAGQSVSAKADDSGRWLATMPALEASRVPLELRVRGASGDSAVVGNLLVGEVWLATGPSNIHWAVQRCDNAAEEIATADFPSVRFFTVAKNGVDQPQDDCQGTWIQCSPTTVGDVSGVAFFYARRLHRELNVPVGIMQSFWGGSRVEAWTSREALEADPQLKPILDWWCQETENFDVEKHRADHERRLDAWRQAVSKAESRGKTPPPGPKLAANPRTSHHRPACLYNGMIAPLIPYGIRGVISYQGLGNLFWAQHSRRLMPAMISDWRKRWGLGDFPFGMIQPAPYPCDNWSRSSPDAYSIQRESQLLVLESVPNTGVALTMDIGDIKQLHFTNKQDVARRMAAWALSTVYGRSRPYLGPVYRSMSVQRDRIRIRFANADSGLTTNDGSSPSHFTVAGEDGVFHPATATIDGADVVVRSEKVPNPVSVRFAWSDTAIPNLFNRDGMPASLFRTDVPPVGR